VVGNFIYPNRSEKSKGIIIHLQGAVALIQDHRAIALANEGYSVLELAYNHPKYGINKFYEEYFNLKYIEMALEKVLSHESCRNHNSATLIGHSKVKMMF